MTPWPQIAGLVGMSSLISQLVGLREFLAAWGGNELVIGIFLACALLLTAAGSSAGAAHRQPPSLLWPLLVAAPLPVAQVLLIRLLRAQLSAVAMPNLAAITLLAAVTLAPACLLYGLLFARTAAHAASAGTPARAYLAETVGAVAGGVLYTIAVAHSVSSLAISAVVMVACLVPVFELLVRAGRRLPAATLAAALLLALAIGARANLGLRTLAGWFPGQTLLEEVDGPYGSLVLTRSGKQRNLFADGLPLASSEDPRGAEELVHLAMAQRRDGRRVLLIGGLAIGADRELAKYGLERIDAVEVDAARLPLLRRLHQESEPDAALRLRIGDARRFVRQASDPYDAALIATPPSGAAATSRLLTVEFFRDLAARLSADGVVALAVGISTDYQAAEELALLRSLRATLAEVFPHVLALPASRVVFLASRKALTSEVAARIEERSVAVSFVDRGHLDALLSDERLETLRRDIEGGGGRLNRDLAPAVYRLQLDHWSSELGGSALWPAAFLLLAFLALARRTLVRSGASVRLAIAGSGVAAMTLELTALLAFQMLRGSLYLELGLLVAAFMLGGAAGARAGLAERARIAPARWLVASDAALAALALLAGTALSTGHASVAAAGSFLYAAFLAALGLLTGLQMPLAVEVLGRRSREPASAGSGHLPELYAADLGGAALGAWTATVLIIPAIGVARSCLLIAGLKFLTASALATGQWRAARRPRPVPRQAAPTTPVRFYALCLLAVITALIAAPGSRFSIYALSFSGYYHTALLALLALGLFLSSSMRPAAAQAEPAGTLRNALRRLLHLLRGETARLFQMAAFSLAAFYPLARCYFQVPYLFCHVCPRVCVFGYLRPFWVPAAVLMNLGSYSWCRRMCPLGAAFEPARAKPALSRRGLRRASALRYAILAGVAWSYFAIVRAADNQNPASADLFTVVFKNAFSLSAVVLAVLIALLLVNRWVPRSFCHLACPVGASCDLANAAFSRLPAGKGADAQDHGC